MKARRKLFHEFLAERKVGPPSQVLKTVSNWHRESPPRSEELAEIPDQEQYPLEIIPCSDKITPDVLNILFVKSQIQVASQNSNSNSLSGSLVESEIFPTEKEFYQYKMDLQAQIEKCNKNENLTVPLSICNDPLCVNSAVPSFHYCLRHLYKDPNFSTQSLVHCCEQTNCSCIVGASTKKCPIH